MFEGASSVGVDKCRLSADRRVGAVGDAVGDAVVDWSGVGQG